MECVECIAGANPGARWSSHLGECALFGYLCPYALLEKTCLFFQICTLFQWLLICVCTKWQSIIARSCSPLLSHLLSLWKAYCSPSILCLATCELCNQNLTSFTPIFLSGYISQNIMKLSKPAMLSLWFVRIHAHKWPRKETSWFLHDTCYLVSMV